MNELFLPKPLDFSWMDRMSDGNAGFEHQHLLFSDMMEGINSGFNQPAIILMA